MLSFFSILLATLIIIFLLTFKRKFINNYLKISKYLSKNKKRYSNDKLTKKRKLNDYIQYKIDDKFYNSYDKSLLRQEMHKLFKGSKEEKIKALKIAENLSDKETINLLKRGLKDMDADIIQICAKLIEKFK